MNAPALSKTDQLRARDGGLCWLCQTPMDFSAVPNSERAPSLEHLIPQCRDGPNTMDNLVLCHPPCNRLLGDMPLVDKIRLREERREARWKSAMRRRIAQMLIG